jgi:type IV pilus assembly protein PilB
MRDNVLIDFAGENLSGFEMQLACENFMMTDNVKEDLRLFDLGIEEKNRRQDDEEDAPVVRFVNKILLEAIKREASDIHFEPYEKSYRVRYRIDGVLYETVAPPLNLATRIVARLKVMSKMDISERRLPQDGHFIWQDGGKNALDFRVSSCPTVGGEKMVLRILDSTSAKIGIENLGYEDFQKKYFLEAIHKPQGMVLVTGATGSGKTVSLYTALNILNTAQRNILTVEDPVEINLEGINQVNINLKAGLDFSTVLRSFLRQDPDVIMVGEIRDLETADIAIKAAQTGHMVLSTLHTNSAAETLVRLMNMGVPAFNLVAAIHLIVSQRLARRLCHHCKKATILDKTILRDFGVVEQDIKQDKWIYEAVGCVHCTNGYRGRVGIYEVLVMSKSINQIIMAGGHAADIAEQAVKEGLQTLHVSGIHKVLEGLTSLDEVNRVIRG